jgi:D-sedoheptulose 7-phosphate isomerase
MKKLLDNAIADLADLLPKLAQFEPQMARLGEAVMQCWSKRGKLLVAGNGGSACDAMHLAEELIARFQKNRRALAAIALCDPTVITCAGNDFGFDTIFSRQVEALGNPGDLLIVFSTSGNSANILRAIQSAKAQEMITVAFLGKDGGQARGTCDIEMIIPAQASHRIQEAHQLLFHTLCEWVDRAVETA